MSLTKNYDFSSVPVTWYPDDIANEHVKKMWQYISEKYDVTIDSYWDLHKWSINNLETFWEEVWHLSKIIHSKTYDQVISRNKLVGFPKWFPGARLNYAENCLRYRDTHVAIFATGEDRETKTITYANLYQEVKRYSAALRKFGLKTNECAASYISNREEAVFAMLGVTSIGAIWTNGLPMLGAEAVIERFQLTKPKILFAVDRFMHNGVEMEMLHKIQEIAERITSLEKIVIVPSSADSLKVDISHIRKSCFLHEFLNSGLNSDGTIPEIVFEQVPLDHPLFISYTSGTTGTSKALIHGSGLLLNIWSITLFHAGHKRERIFLQTSPAGWASWNSHTARLSTGCSFVYYEGMPYFKSPTYLWDLIDKFSITQIFLTPSCLDFMEKKRYVPSEKNHLESLKAIACGASVVKPKNYDFVHNKVKKNVIFGSAYGCTEIMSVCMLMEPTLPIHRGEISAPILGMEISCFNDAGKPIIGEMGELVIANSMPSMMLGVLGDEDGKICAELYLNKFPGHFSTNDLAYINPITRGIVICGRMDDSLQPKGTKYTSSEIYNVVSVQPEVMDSVCVPHLGWDNTERAILFLRMKEGYKFSKSFAQHICDLIEEELTDEHVPDIVLEVKEIPYNATGKKMESIVKKIINKRPYNPGTVTNTQCLKQFENIPELQSL